MSLWADKYRPKTLADLDYHADISNKLKRLSTSGDFPHLLVYGPSGAGKKTRVMALLRELYGSGAERLKVDVKTFQTSSSRKLEFNVISSPFHLEITPSDMGNNDRIVIQDLLKDVGQTESIDFTGLLRGNDQKAVSSNKKKFKVVVINEAELLSRDAQAALRRTMEKFSANIRLILVCNSTSSIIDPIKSRTLAIRVGLPTVEESAKVFEEILQREHVANKVFPADEEERRILFGRVCEAAEQNLRMGIMMLEALYMNNEKVSSGTEMIRPDWEIVIDELASGIIKDRSVVKLQHSRSVLYELLAHAIPAKLILKRLMLDLWTDLDSFGALKDKDGVKRKMVSAASTFDERLSLGSKDIFHLEGFITRVMVIVEGELTK
ncbi:DEKNAAC103305 [Brettanomyces naardenensis]|uniref:DEKNAAC103305 n=1 Tax=Brettanomyces naardenensis TaxID=13370 RepID=A0A448YN15_BRENA|nr:DEKNAAC103305 [Brettanomyces naardenensis]